MDLGNLIGDIAKTYITTRYAPTPVSTPINYMPADFQVGPLNVDPMDLFTQDTGAPVVSFGKKKTCRRRRRRLATMSDIKDLAALKSVLGNGEAFKTWIATHSR